MSLAEANWNPTNRQLRQFGLLCVVLLPLIAWMWSARPMLIGVLALVGLALGLLSWFYPAIVKPVFLGLMLVTLPIGIVIGELAMLTIYMTVFLPIGLLFRLMHRDRLQTKLDRTCSSYWQPKRQPKSSASYYHQS